MTKTTCIFCDYKREEIIEKNNLAYLIYDNYPVNKGHMLIIPFRHVVNFFELTEEELSAIYELLIKGQEKLKEEVKATGFNVGANIGHDAGQTVFHVHMHLIPRFHGDVDDPRGGIRNFKKPLVKYP
ncbi:MAG: HIT family protein [Candidatus Heimdallarchaeota archaeon]|nr:HIT family protein [Candidatus Heimdallarchaeota archaeon]MCK5049134.1 HIT family protein [Candidatus Heimdallarchaeota archaeon]